MVALQHQNLAAINNYLPPQNIQAEESILGGILLDPDAMSRVVEILVPDAFYVQSHKKIYQACLSLHKHGEPTDLMTVTNRLNDKYQLDAVGGMGKLAQLIDTTVSAINIDKHAALVMDKFVRRMTIHTGNEIVGLGHDTTWDTSAFYDIFEKLNEQIYQYRDLLAPKEDKENRKFMKLVEKIKEIEQKTIDPGFKYYKMLNFAKETGHSVAQLQGMYLKSLVANHIESSNQFDDLKKQYGSVVQDWFLHGFGPKGSVVLLHALGGTGKTRLIYDWIYHMVCGKAWHGHQVTAPQRRVLVVQTDESQADLINTMEEMGINNDMPIRFITRWTADHVAALRQEIEKWKPEVILIDSLTSINRNSFYSENDTEYARPILELRDLAQEFGCLIYLIHHSNGEGGSRGTKAIGASVSHILSLSRPSEGSDCTTLKRILCIEKSRSRAPEKYDLEFDPETGGWICHGVVGKEIDSCMDIKERIVDFLGKNRNTCYEATEIHEAIGGSSDRVRLSCFQLAQLGSINRKRRHTQGGGYLYWLTWEEGDRLNEAITLDDHKITLNDQLAINPSNQRQSSVSGEVVFLPPIDDQLAINYPITSFNQHQPSVSGEVVFETAKNSEKTLVQFPEILQPFDQHLLEPLQDESLEGDRQDDRHLIAQEDDHLHLAKVKYIGTDESLVNLCIKKPYLEILGVNQNGEATVIAPGWRITKKIPFDQLEPIER